MEIIQIVALVAALSALVFVVTAYCVGQVSSSPGAQMSRAETDAAINAEQERFTRKRQSDLAMAIDFYKREYGVDVSNYKEATAFQLERAKELYKQDDNEAEQAKISPASVSVIHFGKGKQGDPFIQWDNRLELKERGDVVDVNLAHIDSIRVKRHGVGVMWIRLYDGWPSIAIIEGSIVSLRLISGREVDLHVNRHQTENLIASIVAAMQDHLGKPLAVVKDAAS